VAFVLAQKSHLHHTYFYNSRKAPNVKEKMLQNQLPCGFPGFTLVKYPPLKGLGLGKSAAKGEANNSILIYQKPLPRLIRKLASDKV